MSEITTSPFDVLPERRGTGSIKWERFPGLTPFWVADMDFTSPPCVIEALHSRVAHGVFGYAHAHEGLDAAVLDYLQRSFGVRPGRESLHHLPGLVPALSLACRAFAGPGMEVMVNSPVYYPFHKVHKDAGAVRIDVPHVLEDGLWRFDWESMEAAVTPNTKLLILCNPQNPLGRVFTEEEITRLAEFCERHDLVLLSDEIHCDLILEPGHQHFSALNLPEKLRARTVVLMAPSKTYNIAGLGYSFAVIENPELKKRFVQAIGCTLPEINALAMYAAEAAYRDGEAWRQELLTYLRGNRDTLRDFVASELPQLSIPHEHHATYLHWIDCSALEKPNPADFFSNNAGILLTDGGPFGSRQHVRFNFGCPRSHMLEALEAMQEAIG